MKKLLASLLTVALVAVGGMAYADLTVKDGASASQVMFDFVCFTTKHCSAHVPITSAGAEILPATSTNQSTELTNLGATNETAAASDTATAGLNGRLQRLAQRITSLITLTSDGTDTTYAGSGTATVYGYFKGLYAALTQGVGTTGASVPSNIIYTGCRGQNAEPTSVTNGQLIGDACDLTGKRIVQPFANPENSLGGLITTAMTGTTDTAVTNMGAQGSGVRNYVTGCVISNSHATVGTDVVLKDGSGGSVIALFPAAAAYGGTAVPISPPVKTTANTALYAANITTGASVKLFCTGYKGI